jgi:hypothetical protein
LALGEFLILSKAIGKKLGPFSRGLLAKFRQGSFDYLIGPFYLTRELEGSKLKVNVFNSQGLDDSLGDL